MIRILANVVIRDISKFKKLCAILFSEDQFKQLANDLLTIYAILKCETDIIKGLKYQEVFDHLKLKSFFKEHEEIEILSKHEEIAILPIQDKIEQILIVLKDKSLQCIIDFLMYLKELPTYNALVIKIENEITSLKGDVDNLHTAILTDNSCGAPIRLTENTSLDVFQEYLIQRYNSDNFFRAHSSIRAPKVFHIQLALINNPDDEYFHFSDYSLLYEQESHKTYLDYSDIFTDSHRVIVLQGPPGSGKTTLAKYLCKQWANDTLLKRFSLVIFVQLRNERVANANSFEELIKIYMDTYCEFISKEIFKNHGKDILIILEGWDELSEKLRYKDTIFRSLISGEILPNATVMITTRSSVVLNLPVDECCKIEVIGFSKEKVKEYVDCFFHHDNSMTTQFWEQLRDLPHVKKILFVPVILCIVLHIFQQNKQKIPETYTELYTKFLLCQLSIYHAKTSCDHTKFESLDNLPEDILDMVLKFGKMGYDCLLNSKLSFSEEEISTKCFDSKHIPLELHEVAIFEQHIMVNCSHVSKTYQFIHRTFQELLAAWYVSKQSISFQRKTIKIHFRDKKLEAFWMFYAGLTKFNFISFETALQSNYIHQFKYYISTIIVNAHGVGRNAVRPISIRRVGTAFFTTKLYAYTISNSVPNSFQITLIAAAMESQTPQICKILCNSYIFYQDTCWFTVPANASTPQVLLPLSYCIAHSGKKWAIHCKKLDNTDVDYLLKYLRCSKSADCPCNDCSSFTDRTDNAIYAVDTSSSQHSVDGLVKLVETQRYIQWIILSRSEHIDDNLMIGLCKALKVNTNLKFLHLFGCSITSVGAKAIADMLKENSTLEWIGLRDNEKTLKEEDIILLLEAINSHNTTVYMIILDSVFHEAPKVQELLTTINVNRNNGIEKLCFKIEDSLRFSAICNRMSSFLSYLRARGQPI